MKNDDLERLEKSQDVQQLIHFAKEQYEQEKSEHTPADFSSLMQAGPSDMASRVEVIRNLIRLPLSLQSLIR